MNDHIKEDKTDSEWKRHNDTGNEVGQNINERNNEDSD